jgi:hypothetical protein
MQTTALQTIPSTSMNGMNGMTVMMETALMIKTSVPFLMPAQSECPLSNKSFIYHQTIGEFIIAIQISHML